MKDFINNTLQEPVAAADEVTLFSFVADFSIALQAASWFAAILLALTAILTLFTNLYYKRREERWNGLKKAENLVQDLYENEFTHAALRMSDGSLSKIRLLDEFTANITEKYSEVSFQDVVDALNTPIGEDENIPLATTICHCYDTLFYFLNRFEIYLSERLISFKDVRWPLEYYMQILLKEDGNYKEYIEKIGYPLSIDFIERFR